MVKKTKKTVKQNIKDKTPEKIANNNNSMLDEVVDFSDEFLSRCIVWIDKKELDFDEILEVFTDDPSYFINEVKLVVSNSKTRSSKMLKHNTKIRKFLQEILIKMMNHSEEINFDPDSEFASYYNKLNKSLFKAFLRQYLESMNEFASMQDKSKKGGMTYNDKVFKTAWIDCLVDIKDALLLYLQRESKNIFIHLYNLNDEEEQKALKYFYNSVVFNLLDCQDESITKSLLEITKYMQSNEEKDISFRITQVVSRFIEGVDNFRHFKKINNKDDSNLKDNQTLSIDLVSTAIKSINLTVWNIEFLMYQLNRYNDERIIKEIFNKICESDFINLELNCFFKALTILKGLSKPESKNSMWTMINDWINEKAQSIVSYQATDYLENIKLEMQDIPSVKKYMAIEELIDSIFDKLKIETKITSQSAYVSYINSFKTLLDCLKEIVKYIEFHMGNVEKRTFLKIITHKMDYFTKFSYKNLKKNIDAADYINNISIFDFYFLYQCLLIYKVNQNQPEVYNPYGNTIQTSQVIDFLKCIYAAIQTLSKGKCQYLNISKLACYLQSIKIWDYHLDQNTFESNIYETYKNLMTISHSDPTFIYEHYHEIFKNNLPPLTLNSVWNYILDNTSANMGSTDSQYLITDVSYYYYKSLFIKKTDQTTDMINEQMEIDGHIDHTDENNKTQEAYRHFRSNIAFDDASHFDENENRETFLDTEIDAYEQENISRFDAEMKEIIKKHKNNGFITHLVEHVLGMLKDQGPAVDNFKKHVIKKSKSYLYKEYIAAYRYLFLNFMEAKYLFLNHGTNIPPDSNKKLDVIYLDCNNLMKTMTNRSQNNNFEFMDFKLDYVNLMPIYTNIISIINLCQKGTMLDMLQNITNFGISEVSKSISEYEEIIEEQASQNSQLSEQVQNKRNKLNTNSHLYIATMDAWQDYFIIFYPAANINSKLDDLMQKNLQLNRNQLIADNNIKMMIYLIFNFKMSQKNTCKYMAYLLFQRILYNLKIKGYPYECIFNEFNINMFDKEWFTFLTKTAVTANKDHVIYYQYIIQSVCYLLLNAPKLKEDVFLNTNKTNSDTLKSCPITALFFSELFNFLNKMVMSSYMSNLYESSNIEKELNLTTPIESYSVFDNFCLTSEIFFYNMNVFLYVLFTIPLDIQKNYVGRLLYKGMQDFTKIKKGTWNGSMNKELYKLYVSLENKVDFSPDVDKKILIEYKKFKQSQDESLRQNVNNEENNNNENVEVESNNNQLESAEEYYSKRLETIAPLMRETYNNMFNWVNEVKSEYFNTNEMYKVTMD